VHNEKFTDLLLHGFFLLVFGTLLTRSSSVLLSLLVVSGSLLSIQLGFRDLLFASSHGIFMVLSSLLDSRVKHEASY
jgi:hypothetical protein